MNDEANGTREWLEPDGQTVSIAWNLGFSYSYSYSYSAPAVLVLAQRISSTSTISLSSTSTIENQAAQRQN